MKPVLGPDDDTTNDKSHEWPSPARNVRAINNHRLKILVYVPHKCVSTRGAHNPQQFRIVNDKNVGLQPHKGTPNLPP